VTEPALKARIAFAESALCGLITAANNLTQDLFDCVDWENCGVERAELHKWYDEHLERERKVESERLAKAKREREGKIANALAKLSAEEIKLLGLDK
jgi:hypothetical protein